MSQMRWRSKLLTLALGVVLLLGVYGIGAVFAKSDGPLNSLVDYPQALVDKVAALVGAEGKTSVDPPVEIPNEIPAEGSPTPEPSRPTAVPKPVAATDWPLQLELEEYLEDQSGVYGLALRNLDTGQTVLINPNMEFPSASTYKLLVMYKVYQQMDSGLLDADDLLTITWEDLEEEDPGGGYYPGQEVTVGDALEVMITISSNHAAYALTRLVGGWDKIDAAADEFGMGQTEQGLYFFRTTPADMLRFFEILVNGQMVSASASRSMMQLLERQTVNDRIPALLPAGTIVAHKTGELYGVRNDVGIVYGPRGFYIISMFSQQAPENEATEVIATIALRAYQRYASGNPY